MEEETIYCINVLQFLAHAKQANASTGLNAGFFHEALCFTKR